MFSSILKWFRDRKKLVSRFPGFFDVECHNPDGSLAWRERIRNGTTTLGLNDILNVYFNSSTQKTTWYIGLIDNLAFTALAPADTIAAHGGWAENTAYTAGSRPAWGPAAASGGIMVNPTAVAFTANANVNIRGAFLVSDATKGGTAGLMWSTGLFASSQAITNGQTLSFSYTVPVVAN